MEKTDWVYIFAIVLIVCLTALGITGKMSTEDLKELFILIFTSLVTGVAGYFVGRRLGYIEGKGEL